MDRKVLNLRITSAIIFAVLFLGSILYHRTTFIAFFLLVAFAGGREYTRMQKRYERRIFRPRMGIIGGIFSTLPVVVYYIVAISGIESLILKCLLVLSLVLTVVVIIDMFRAKRSFLYGLPYQLSSLIYPGIFLATPVIVVLDIDGNYEKYYLLLLIFCIWAADVGAYVIGSMWGKHKLFPRLSPNKTIEGALGGIMSALLLGYLSALSFDISISIGLLIGFTCGVLSIIGDLFESKLKRTAMLKDSSRIMPGHGGILDRFDGFILALPTVSYILWKTLDLG